MTVNTADAASRATAMSGVDWTPYLVGAGMGVLSWLVFVIADAPLGITTELTEVAAGVAQAALGADRVAQNTYLAENLFAFDYGVLFLVGVFLGGFVSSLMKGDARLEAVPSEWRRSFGGSAAKRFAAAFVGGLILMYGARLADGCTSGNALSGGLQLAVSGWVFMAVMFPAAIAAAALIYRSR